MNFKESGKPGRPVFQPIHRFYRCSVSGDVEKAIPSNLAE
jgi:hypothetical protein